MRMERDAAPPHGKTGYRSELGQHRRLPWLEIMERGYLEILSAFGCPSALFFDSSAAGQRESYRRFFSLTVEPLALMLAAELSLKMETPIGISFSGRFSGDLAGRARAFQSDDLGRDGPCQGGGIGRADGARGLTDG